MAYLRFDTSEEWSENDKQASQNLDNVIKRAQSGSKDEPWRLKDEDDLRFAQGSNLCDLCRSVDFRSLFTWKVMKALHVNAVFLGYISDLEARHHCGFCKLVLHSLRENTGFDPLPTAWQGRRIECFLDRRGVASIRNDDGFVVAAIEIVTRPALPQRMKHLSFYTDVPSRLAYGSGDGEDMLIRDVDEDGEIENSPAAIVQPWVQYDTFREWLAKCKCEKQTWAYEGAPLNMRLPNGFRVIDVDEGCLVETTDSNQPFVALSYVWGKLKRPTLTCVQSNITSLSTKGGLSVNNTALSQTVRDAFVVVKRLGHRYLWVDALCIIQDSSEDQSAQISAMNYIYQSAVLTIVAVASDNADGGLPGVWPTARSGQQSVDVQGLTLVNSMLPTGYVLDAAFWNSRAWTYQERLLSQRLLIFSAQQTYFKTSCCQLQLQEDHRTDEGWHAPSTKQDSVSLNLRNSNVFIEYTRAVINYTRRNLSYDADGWNAFVGAATYQEPLLRCDMLYGLPNTYFDMALLWHPKGKLRRRLSDTPDKKPLFSSWSWVGWSGPITFDGERKLSSRLLFRNLAQCRDASKLYSAQDFRPDTTSDDWVHWNRFNWVSWRDARRPEEGHHFPVRELPSWSEFMYCDPMTGRLQFWTYCVDLMLTEGELPETLAPKTLQDPFTYSDGVWRALVNAASEVIGVIHLNVDVTEIDLSQPQPIILLSRTTSSTAVITGPEEYLFAPAPGSADNRSWDERQFEFDKQTMYEPFPETGFEGKQQTVLWDRYNVMMLDTISGEATRLGIGMVWVAAFQAANPKRTFVTLR